MTIRTRATSGPLDPADRLRLAQLVVELGESAVVTGAGISRQTVARALGGLRVYSVSIAAIRAYLRTHSPRAA